MSILSQLTYSLEVEQSIFLQTFVFERHIEDPELQVDALLETSSAKMKTRNRAAIGDLNDTLKFQGQLGIRLREYRYSGRLEPVSDIKDRDTLIGNFRVILKLHSMENSKLAAHVKESPLNATYLSPDIQNELITLIVEEILSSISFKVEDAFCVAVIADETTVKSIKIS